MKGDEVFALNWIVIQVKKYIYLYKRDNKEISFTSFLYKLKCMLKMEKNVIIFIKTIDLNNWNGYIV